MIFNNPERNRSVTSYIPTVTLDILKEYEPELALAGAYHRILLVVTSPKG